MHLDSGIRAADYLRDERFPCAKVNGNVRIIDRFGRSHSVPLGGSEGEITVTNEPIPWHCGGGGAQDWSPPPAPIIFPSREQKMAPGTSSIFRN